MSNFVPLRMMLTENRPNFNKFAQLLDKQQIQKRDLDILLRKAVESKVSQFRFFCDALVRKGANVNFYDLKDNVSNLMLACQKGNIEMVRALLAYKQINLLHSDLRQLHAGFYAIENKSQKQSELILKVLLEREKLLVNKEAANQTLLIAGIRKNKVQIVKLLLEFGADPNWHVPDTGNTALHDAIKHMKSKTTKAITEIIKLLLYYGGNTLQKNKQSKNVYEYAQKALQQFQKIELSVFEQKQKEQMKVQFLLELNTDNDIINLYSQADKIFNKYQGIPNNYKDINQQNIFLEEDQSYGKRIDNEIDDLKRKYNVTLKEIQSFNQIYGMYKQEEIDNIQREKPYLKAQLKKIEKKYKLSKEIREFQKECLRDYKIAQEQLNNWLSSSGLQIIARANKLLIQKVGSFSTGLWIKHSNIDLLLVRQDYQFCTRQQLESIYQQLKKTNSCKSVTINSRNVRSPFIRVQLQNKYHQPKSKFINISLMNQGNNSINTKKFILQQKERFPILQPIFYVLKYLTYYFNLSEPRQYGLRTYALILMILSRILEWNEPNLGKLLIDFLYYFGYYYQYHFYETMMPMANHMNRNEYQYQFSMVLHIYDPINPSNDAGKNIRASDLQKMFKIAYLAINLNMPQGQRLRTMYQINTMILP